MFLAPSVYKAPPFPSSFAGHVVRFIKLLVLWAVKVLLRYSAVLLFMLRDSILLVASFSKSTSMNRLVALHSIFITFKEILPDNVWLWHTTLDFLQYSVVYVSDFIQVTLGNLAIKGNVQEATLEMHA